MANYALQELCYTRGLRYWGKPSVFEIEPQVIIVIAIRKYKCGLDSVTKHTTKLAQPLSHA